MTQDPVCCLPTVSVAKAAQMMKAEDVGSIPVIEDEQTMKLIGIVTDRDLALQVVALERDAGSTQVEDVMTYDVVTCRVSDDVQVAVDAMSQHQLRRMPVVDHENRIVGIISQADVATRVERSKEVAEMVKDISQPAS
jgi:CBS domain-containing protein